MVWERLERHARATADRPIASLFEDGPRARDFSVRAGGMLFD